ncbi:hypothetical protein ACRRTK_004216 [Alexandromys fortis]
MPRLSLLLLLWGTSSYAFPVFQEGHRQDVETVWVNGCNIAHGGNASLDFLSFCILNYTPLLPRAVVDQSIAKAFRVWSDVTPLTFSRVFDEEGDIVLAFYSGDHGDNNPFDGSSYLLAHAFQPGPGIGGDVHFDLDERWTDTSENFNLFYVTAHELGHSLGLAHSNDIGALMFPSYTWYVDDFVLNQEDIDRIQALYGPSPNPIQPTGATTPRVCDSALSFDAITTFRGEVIFFKGRFYIRLIRTMPEPHLNLIGILWPDLPGKLDAAYENSIADKAYFFKGNRVWAIREQSVQAGFPTDIYSYFGFPSSVTHIDAAVCEEETGKTYFFVDDKYWRYDENNKTMDSGYPKLIADDFPRVGNKVDAVFQKNAYPLQGAVRQEPPNMDFAQQYLEKYYNLDKNEKQMFKRKNSSPVVKKIQEMQKFLGLEMTGKLDSNTMDVMLKPRCGIPDVGGFSIFPGSPKWRKNHLTYRVENYTPDLPRESVDSAIEKALKVWEAVTPLRFSRLSEGEADIMISFAAGEHGDFIPFDGPGGVLAHAYAPGLGINGDAHFDDDEQWTEDTTDKTEALMYPVYKSSTDLARFRLSQDDVDGIQSLYGPPPASPDVPVVPSKPNTPEPELSLMCSPDLSFDAVSTLRGEFLFFKDSMDAAYEVTSRDTVFVFKGTQFWAVRGHEEQAGYPKSIHALGFPLTVRKIDAAVSAKETKKTYFFVGDQYWRFDEKKRSMEPGFPRKIAKDFPGIDSKVDAVFEAFGFFYFFSGSSQLEFDPNAKKVTHVLKSNSWFNC